MQTGARILLAAALCLGAGPALALGTASLAAHHLQQLDEPAPDFVLHDTTEPDLPLAALRGHPVIVHFWATWCTSCRKELPVLAALAHRLSASDVEFLAVAIDTDATRADIDRYTAGLGITFPVYLARESRITDRYWTWGVPVTYLIDRQGRIAGRALGPRDWDSPSMRALIRQFAADRARNISRDGQN
jgi:thiol-disulfide isomerase/thioredoxin